MCLWFHAICHMGVRVQRRDKIVLQACVLFPKGHRLIAVLNSPNNWMLYLNNVGTHS